jgi:hypothetical protein
MAAYRFTPIEDPYITTIGQLMGRESEIRSRAALQVADAQARALEARGQAAAQMWGGIGQGISAIANIPSQLAQAKTQQQQQQLNQLRLQEATREAAGKQALAGILQPSQLGPEDVGPRQESYMTSDNLFDVPKITARLGALGYGDLAGDLTQSAERINDSIQKHQKLDQERKTAQTVMFGDIADGVIRMREKGTPLAQAIDFVGQPAVLTGRIDPNLYQQTRDQLLQLPEEQQTAALERLRDQAAMLSPTKTLAEGAQEVDRYGRVKAAGAPKGEAGFTLGPGQVRYGAGGEVVATGPPKEEKEAKLYEVTVPGPGGQPVKKLVTADELKDGITQYREPKEVKPEGLTPNASLEATLKLRDRFVRETAAANTVQQQFNLMRSSLEAVKQGKMAPGSQGVLVTFQKILDPTSVVRESEYARSAAGLSLLSRLQGTWDRIQAGGAGVPVAELQGFVDLAEQFVRNQAQTANLTKEQIDNIAKQYGLDPANITREFGGAPGGTTAPPTTPPVTIKSITPVK